MINFNITFSVESENPILIAELNRVLEQHFTNLVESTSAESSFTLDTTETE